MGTADTITKNILVIDDDLSIHKLIGEVVEGNCAPHFAVSSEEGLAAAKSLNPALIVLDIGLPGMDGYETCRHIRADESTRDSCVIFLSGHDTEQERLAAYDAGGDDFLSKPFLIGELRRKIALLLQQQENRREMHKRLDDTHGMVMTVMSTSGELGVVLRFFQSSLLCKGAEELAQALLHALNEYGLNGAAQIRIGHHIVDFNSSGKGSPLEHQILSRLRNGGRIVDNANRTSVNYEHITLLVRNMPTDDADRYGRMKDNICLLTEAANARANSLHDMELILRQQQAIQKTVAGIRQAIGEVNTRFKRQQSEAMSLFGDMNERLTGLFVHLGLTDDQENAIAETAAEANRRSQAAYDEGLEIDNHLNELLRGLEDVLRENFPNS